MKKFNVSIRVLALTLLIGGLSSCSDKDSLLDENVTAEKEIILGEINELAFNGNVLSRVETATTVKDLEEFFEDKLICMYVDKVTTDDKVVPYYDRKYLTVENGKLVTPEPLYFPSDGSKVNIYVVAASPFSTANDANTAKPTQFYQYCQGWQPNSNSDLLYAKLEKVTASNNPLSLQFKHLGTKISVAVTTPDNSKLTKIRVLKTRCQSIYKMDDGTYIETTDAVNDAIEMPKDNALNTNFDSVINYASVYIAPQTIDSSAQFIEFTFDEKTYFYTLPGEITFASEHEYKFNITLKEKAAATRSGSDMEVVCVNENF